MKGPCAVAGKIKAKTNLERLSEQITSPESRSDQKQLKFGALANAPNSIFLPLPNFANPHLHEQHSNFLYASHRMKMPGLGDPRIHRNLMH